MYLLSKSCRADSKRSGSPDMPAASMSLMALPRSGSSDLVESAVRTPVTPTVSTIRRSGRRAPSGSDRSIFLAWPSSFLRVPTFFLPVCWTTLSLNSATLPLEPNTKKLSRRSGSSILRFRTIAVDGIIWKVRLRALARHASSRK